MIDNDKDGTDSPCRDLEQLLSEHALLELVESWYGEYADPEPGGLGGIARFPLFRCTPCPCGRDPETLVVVLPDGSPWYWSNDEFPADRHYAAIEHRLYRDLVRYHDYFFRRWVRDEKPSCVAACERLQEYAAAKGWC
jgi:hypothetical protein